MFCLPIVLMNRIKIHSLALLMVILALLPETQSQRPRPMPIPTVPLVPPGPLCASQLTLVNYACSMLPSSPALPMSHPSPPSPPSLPSLPDDGYDSRHIHGCEQGHGHRHRNGRQATREQENCCRWLREVDNECVCDLLVHLPLFLSKPIHAYTVHVDASCNVTFTCGGRLRP
ncbi:hypothetical protein ACOSQ2_001576 [Xanthoceras sorbifolium]